jgi:hypothetical protein
VLTLRRIQQPPSKITSSRRWSSCSLMVRASFSKCSGFSLAFARGLRRWLLAVRVDLRFPTRWQCALAAASKQDLFRVAAVRGVKNPKGFGIYL